VLRARAERLTEHLLGIYMGYSTKPWARRAALLIGLGLAAYGFGSFTFGDPEMGVMYSGFAAFWFLKMWMWSFLKSGGRPPP
jgi:hypothetical protein